jgi:hypothetical protein
MFQAELNRLFLVLKISLNAVLVDLLGVYSILFNVISYVWNVAL